MVDTLADLRGLLKGYSLNRGRAEDHFFQPLDFERMAADFDAVHLTDEGQWATRLTQPSLYGWDCESTCWLRWAFERAEPGPAVELVGVRYSWDDDDDEEA